MLAIAISASGFDSINAQENFNQGQVQQNGCCPACRQSHCRCRQRLQFVNPDQFLCEPQWQNLCPPNSDGTVYPPSGVDSSNPQPNSIQPGTQPNDQPGVPQINSAGQNSSNDFAISTRLGSGNEVGFRTAMIGDFFGGGGFISGPSWGGVNITSPTSGGDRRYKLTEATSPIPTDRVFLNYNMFANALTDANGNELDLTRYAFGLEKTFFNEDVSVELRIPILEGVSSRQTQIVGGPANRNSELGNMSLTTKFLLAEGNGWTYSSGLGVIFPTASTAILTTEQDDPGFTVEFENEAFYLQPFFAVQRTLGQWSWINFYTHCDFATQGNTITVYNEFGGLTNTPQIYNDQNLLFFDLSMGRWIYQSNRQNQRLRGVAGIFELHHTTTLNDTDIVSTGQDSSQSFTGDTLTNPSNRLDVLNTTLGLRFLVGQGNSLTVAGVAPLRINEEHLFDSEISVQFNHLR